MHINDLLHTAVHAGASDLHLKVGSYPMMRVSGKAPDRHGWLTYVYPGEPRQAAATGPALRAAK